MFEKIDTALPGCYELQPIIRADDRGQFVKTFHSEYFESNNLETNFVEQYYSISKKGVLRGMHFQKPPHEHAKVVYCTAGTILDVALDLRIGSPMYGKHISLELSANSGNMLYLPSGVAHGFYALSEATVLYNVSSVYSPESDAGVMWNSFDMNWPNKSPDLSDRDTTFPTLEDFQSPFHIS
jgi:dTDP-4-dehydrorhamnose 3,5-epimerase